VVEPSRTKDPAPRVGKPLPFGQIILVTFQVFFGAAGRCSLKILGNGDLPLRAEFSRANTFLFAVFLVGLIRSASVGSSRVEAAINHASSPHSSPLAGFQFAEH
jgi:hypothetical protein